MNNIIFQTIRAGIIVGVALFAFASDALAAPVLTPVAVTHLTGTSATLVGYVSNPYKNSTVWMEWNIGTSLNATPTTVAVQGIWGEGSFEWNLRDLTPGQTYSYRSVAMEGGVTVYSPMSSFVAPVPVVVAPVVINAQPVSSVISSSAPAATSKPVATQTASQAQTNKNTTAAVSGNQATTTPVSTDGFTNNSAAAIGAGDGMLPTTLFGWIALIAAILVMVIISHMIYEAPIKRKRALEEAKKKEEGSH